MEYTNFITTPTLDETTLNNLLNCHTDDDSQVGGKRIKMSPHLGFTDLDIVESCYILLSRDPNFYKNKWSCSNFINKYLNHELREVQWIACHCIALITGMSEEQLRELIISKMPIEVHEEFSCIYSFVKTLNKKEKSSELNSHVTINKQPVNDVVEVSGIYIPKLPVTVTPKDDIVVVDSAYNNLRKVALCLSSKKGICLQGPVGSGKTTLIEHLAHETGRKLGENFIKVQLGDETDSKMLLGMYRCTDIPGEFVWQPGVLTQAVIEGHWLLLEDIDSASMDIASVLSSLLENGTLTVPGYRDSISVTPGFRLFLTQRLVSTVTGHHKKHSSAMVLLEKYLLQINIDPLTSSELKDIVMKRYPQFTTIADRMLNVFQLFSKNVSGSSEMTLPKTTRLISTRDFFKWCARAAIGFDIRSQESARKVLQDAIDVFCCSYPKVDDAVDLARQISTHLGIINEEADFFFKEYNPIVDLTSGSFTVGRARMTRDNEVLVPYQNTHQNYYFTRPSAVLLERIMCCVNLKEPVLLVGETGTGKTSSVQYLANILGQKLIVINMNQQSDSADLLGGFKPVDLKFIFSPIRREFEDVFRNTFQIQLNNRFLEHIAVCYNTQRWSDLVTLMTKSYEAALARLTKTEPDDRTTKILPRWQAVGEKLQKLRLQLRQKNAPAFSFIEGSLVKAVQQGYWVLLDEINLANAETLECLSGLLEGTHGSLCLLERGDKQPVKRHQNFTLFACMNPSTDVGKKDLPAGLRNRFTEFFVGELTEKQDLVFLVDNYLKFSSKDKVLQKIVDFYLKVRKETETTLTDGLGHKPHFSLRSLCRALMIAAKNPCGMFKKSLYEAFCLSFLTQLDASSYKLVQGRIAEYLVGDKKAFISVLKQPIPKPRGDNSDEYLQFEDYWIRKGALECAIPNDYILTDSVRKNLKDLARIVSIGHLPVLLQGDTSVGKTSLITYLAKSSGNKCVRINNHEHTDLQEYIGSYVNNCDGTLVFREGLLVEAMRKGHWIILDELNLAPTDVLEALNRVLDDNRELFIPETQETVKANSNFMLFATQNPPGSYGGRKMLSRAFRNRFVELHFTEIPPLELEVILHKRCAMPLSYAKKMINVMTDLQKRRRGSAAFAGKQGFMTLRDLFRWGERYRLAQINSNLHDWDQHLADEGYLVLAGRVRKDMEKKEIIEVLKKHLKREVNPHNLFTLSDDTSPVTKDLLTKIYENGRKFPNIVWTYNMRQLAVLVGKAFQFKEPVLLVGETGGGKTTVCQLIAEQNGQELSTVNCHMHTESSDFIGGLRPVRERKGDDANKFFEWVDGPLVQAMQRGNVFLADEISLADDSVLERLNSLLEPERTLLLAEKGSDINNTNNSESIVAHENFYFIGTMNPGGDFGKKELSPALRNRFTEIWCESCTNRDDLIAIIEKNVNEGISLGNQEDGSSGIGINIMNFINWFRNTEIGKRITVSIRDILTWVNFVNVCAEKIDVCEAYLHGAFLTFLDGLGSGITGTDNLKFLDLFRNQCYKFLQKQVKSSVSLTNLKTERSESSFGIKPFFIEMGEDLKENYEFSFNTPTTIYNTLRLLRGMQLHKAILLEGSPGVGKTSLVTALAKFTCHKIFRVNLSDQTDISDLFGADLPKEGGVGGEFSWRDGPLLQALKQGHWILLDELNLASQSVLEGLNACLDHRGEIFVPELGRTFHVKPGTRFFACQNPLKQGGSRRGLPQSFLNRFIQVYVNSFTHEDLGLILKNQFPNLPQDILNKMLEFNSRVVEETESHNFANKGSPWEFNLRDLTRWCEAMIYHYSVNPSDDRQYQPESVVQLIYSDRLRTLADKIKLSEIFEEVFRCKISGDAPTFYVNSEKIYIGDATLSRNNYGIDTNAVSEDKSSLVLRSQLSILRSLTYCVNLNWMSLLVGNSASGKSSVVRALANLSGKTLRTLPVTSEMDTTDILGGFEQTDYTRHLEEIAKETEQVVYETVRTQLIRGQSCISLLQYWEAYTNLNNVDTKRTMNEEAQLFSKKVYKLEMIWEKLCSEQDFRKREKIHALKEKSSKMLEHIKKEGSLTAGGKFEWVNSVLIKCLQDGSWLLIDNVNLCSAAVLDRLNALLEPNGVLTVGERGVDESGKMIEIKPHPDFRLFLTMDPKNGEISRAMRNRGIEIYILNETEMEERNDFDVKSLIDRQGLNSVQHINALLELHDFISELILWEKPNLNELLRAANLIALQMRHGAETFVAFSTSLVEIYYKSRSPMEFSCNDFSTIVGTEIERLLGSEPDENEMYCKNITLKTHQLQKCANLEKISQQGVILEKCLRQNQLDVFDRIKYFLINFYSTSSTEDLELRKLYCDSLVKTNVTYQPLSDEMYNFIRNYSRIHYKEFPVDCRWIPDTNFPGRNIYLSNLIVLGLHFTANLQQELLSVQEAKTKAKKQMSLRNYMVLRKSRKVEEQFDDVLTENLLDLLSKFDGFLLKSLHEDIELSDNEVVKILQLLIWRFILHRYTSTNIKKVDATERYLILTNLKVHYRWFFKYSLNAVAKILKKDLPPSLESVLKVINNSLKNQFSLLHQYGKNYQKYNKKPLPKTSEIQIKFSNLLQEVTKMFDICDKSNSAMKILNIFHKEKNLISQLIGYKLSDEDVDVKIKSLEKLKEDYLSYVKTSSTDQFEGELLPFDDYFMQLKIRKYIFNQDDNDDEYHEFKTTCILPVELTTSILYYKNMKDERIQHELFRGVFGYLMNSASVKFGSDCNPQESLVLSGVNPLLVYHLTSLLIGTGNGAVTTFGNFRQLSKVHQKLNLTLWRNFQQLHDDDYDYLLQEQQFINHRFKQFIQELSQTLNLNSDNLNELGKLCLNQLSNLNGTDAFSESFIKHFNNCIENFFRLNEEKDFDVKTHLVANLYIEISYLKAVLNSRLPLIDPCAKKELKKKYYSESITSFEVLKESFTTLNKINGRDRKSLHAHYHPVMEMVEKLKVKHEELGCFVAVRPRDIFYEEVVKVVNHGFSTILSSQQVDSLILDMNNSIKCFIETDKDVPLNDISENLKQFDSAVISFENLIYDWSKYCSAYPDVIEPLLSNVCEFLYGFKLSVQLVKKFLLRHQSKLFDIDAQTALMNLVRIPCLNRSQNQYQSVILSYTDKKFQNFVFSTLKDDDTPKAEMLRLLKCGIQESFNNCVIEAATGSFSSKIFSHFGNLLKAFVNLWNEQETEREIQEKEADTLYKMKTRHDDKTEDEQIRDELKELFPNYHDEDFADMQKNVKLDDDPVQVTPNKAPTKLISTEDVKFVVDLHILLIQNFTKTDWLNPVKDKKFVPNFIFPLIEKYKLFKMICEKTIEGLDYRVNKELIESVGILLSFVQNYGNITGLVDQSSPVRISHRKSFDFYNDSNVEEVKASFHILEELKLRVLEILEEWPEHPTLRTIVTIIERIYNFDISSPISRFLTGFEILLNKCHEWEEVAHSKLSLSQFSQNITHQIIEWRKIELSVWKDILNNTFTRANDPIYKWWVYLYNIMEQFVIQDKFTEIELIETLQNYITRSNLAEYQNRLNLLYAFHCHAVHLKHDAKSESFVRILWNLYSYFQQFTPVVINKIKDLRAPIEKKVKDYIKIVRWKDINYWAIKETVDKSHKTLHKFVREFQDVLRQPVSPYLVNTVSSNKIENVGIWDRPQRNSVKTYHYTLDVSTYVTPESYQKKLNPKDVKGHQQLFNRVNSCFAKSRKLCKDTISATKYPKLIHSLDDFVTQVIETSSHLQGLEVDTTLSKEKQKSHAKNILQQKHRALADLFKILSKIGLSFKTGIVEANLKMAAENFLIRPVDLSANFSHISYSRKDEKILTIWDSCEMYYLKAQMRADVLDTALKTPASDLGLQNIERCRGFSSNLLMVVQKQKKQLTDSSIMMYYLRHYTSQMTKLCEAKFLLPLETVDRMRTVLKNIAVVVAQAKIFLNTCPESESLLNSEVIILKPHSSNFIQFKYDPLWKKACDLLNDILSVSNRLCIDLEKYKGDIPSYGFDIVSLKYIPVTDLSHIVNKLDDILQNIGHVVSIFGRATMSDSFNWLAEELEQSKTCLNSSSNLVKSNQKNEKQLQKLVEALTGKVYSAIQNISKRYSEKAVTNSENEDELENEHLKELIVNNIEGDMEILNMKIVLKSCQEIAEIFYKSPNEHNKETISCVLPLLEQTILFHEYFLTQQVSSYRVTCKMSSVLLNIFIDLVSKGFCIPPELIEGDEGGVSKPSDGLGLGEGEGERDVSDKIESEDQLQDAQPAGQEKEKEDDKDCKEESNGIEMSEDFDSKLQDIEKNEDEDENENSDSDADEQMGEIEDGADRQNKETFGSDEDNEEDGNEEEETDKNEERGEGGEKEGESELAAKEEKQSKSSDKDDKASNKEKEEQKQEINEMDEPEFDDSQIDPYHGNQPELEEPEPMDLPDDLQLDDGEENENEGPEEENPFDVDAMKEDNPFEKQDKNENSDEEKHDDQNNYSSDDEEITRTGDDENDENLENDENSDDKKNEFDEVNEGQKDEDESTSETQQEIADQSQSNQDNVQAMEVDGLESSDKTQPNQAQNQKTNNPIEDLCQEDSPDKEGVGQSQMEESSSGHTAPTDIPRKTQSSKREREEDLNRKQKPGESDSKRTLGDVNEPVKKKLKTVDSKEEDNGKEGEENDQEMDETAEMYKHIKEAKEKSAQVLDAATKEQAESQKKEIQNSEEAEKEGAQEETESPDLPPEKEEIIESNETKTQKPEKTESRTNNNKKQHPEGDVLEEIQETEVEGDIVETLTVARGFDTIYNTMYNELKEASAVRLSQEEINLLRSEVEKQLSAWNEVPSDAEADKAWQKISSVTSPLAQDLAEQLRLVLEPSQASRLKGDYRTGRRINMRKVIPYIASQFRKDKIWLRRTKPSKREYQIVLAIDDTASMVENQSKELAFESAALISKALTILESGQLSVVSFGEETEILHKLTDQFTEKSGVKLLQKFKFDQKKTCVAKLVNFVTEMFLQNHVQSSALNAKLLVIISDAVFSEDNNYVRQAVRRAKLLNIFMIFVIIDNPDSKYSILDRKMPVFSGNKLIEIQNYMDVFPFPFYIILRDINALPNVLSDALRQWFEAVSNLDRQ